VIKADAPITGQQPSEMSKEDFSFQYGALGRIIAWSVFLLGVAYAVITLLGFISLKSPQEPIGDPYFLLMELLILLMAPLMVVVMVVVHAYASAEKKIYSWAALIFMVLMAGITSSNHFVILTVGRMAVTDLGWFSALFSFQWPSVAYALDILAWDWFFALSMLCAAPIFEGDRLERLVRTLMLVSGGLSLIGLLGVPLANMQIRNIGIIGYGVVAPIVFLLLGMVFGRVNAVFKSAQFKS